VEDLEQDRHLLLGLIEALRDDGYQSTQLLALIRSNASLDDIRVAISNRMEGLSLPISTSGPESSSWGAPSSSASSVSPMPSNSGQVDMHAFSSISEMNSRNVMNIDRLTDIPLFELSAKPWTEVTTDNGFVSHLISLWLTWDHVVRNWIDKDLFIAAMKSGDVNSPFCSPFLVNIILSQACVSLLLRSRLNRLELTFDCSGIRTIRKHSSTRTTLTREDNTFTMKRRGIWTR
jgi:hypothetical protein